MLFTRVATAIAVAIGLATAGFVTTAPNATLRSRLGQQADDLRCPTSDTRCTGTTAVNSFFGEGRVDAFQAVS